MKKILAYLCIISGLLVLGMASSKSLMHKIWDRNNAHIDQTSLWCKHNNMGGGDLIKLSFLDDIKKYYEPKYYQFDSATDNGNRNIDLYLYGDSYTEDIPGRCFANTGSYHYGRKIKGLTYSLDQNKKNILIIEITERLVLETFTTTSAIYSSLHRSDTTGPKGAEAQKVTTASTNVQDVISKRSALTFIGKPGYSQIVNTNLEYLLFDYTLINKIRQLKADANYLFFHRASGDVSISDNGKYIFFLPTTQPNGVYSSYTPVNETDLADLINTLNEVYYHYKNDGFSEVYFSVIPNAATILQPDNYNRFIPLIQKNASLKMPVIDVYSVYKSAPDPSVLYRRGDTHWNNNGMQIWLGLVNNELRKQSLATQ